MNASNLRVLLAYLIWCLVRGSCTHNCLCLSHSVRMWMRGVEEWCIILRCSLLGLNIRSRYCVTEASGGKVLPGVPKNTLGYERVLLHIFIYM